jgi:hypothetical protein
MGSRDYETQLDIRFALERGREEAAERAARADARRAADAEAHRASAEAARREETEFLAFRRQLLAERPGLDGLTVRHEWLEEKHRRASARAAAEEREKQRKRQESARRGREATRRILERESAALEALRPLGVGPAFAPLAVTLAAGIGALSWWSGSYGLVTLGTAALLGLLVTRRFRRTAKGAVSYSEHSRRVQREVGHAIGRFDKTLRATTYNTTALWLVASQRLPWVAPLAAAVWVVRDGGGLERWLTAVATLAVAGLAHVLLPRCREMCALTWLEGQVARYRKELAAA